jgi:hypothetical protein
VYAKRDEPLSGCGVQQTRDLRAEETVEVGRNHEDGTRFDGWHSSDRWGLRLPGVDARWACWQEGTTDESHERRAAKADPPHSSALEGSEVHEGFRDNRLRSATRREPRECLEGQAGDGQRPRRKRERPTTRYRIPRLGKWFHNLALAALKGP